MFNSPFWQSFCCCRSRTLFVEKLPSWCTLALFLSHGDAECIRGAWPVVLLGFNQPLDLKINPVRSDCLWADWPLKVAVLLNILQMIMSMMRVKILVNRFESQGLIFAKHFLSDRLGNILLCKLFVSRLSLGLTLLMPHPCCNSWKTLDGSMTGA